MGLFGGSKNPEDLINSAMALMQRKQPKAALSLFKKALKVKTLALKITMSEFMKNIRMPISSDKNQILSFCEKTFSWGDYIHEVWDS